jgi:hypothetical protein
MCKAGVLAKIGANRVIVGGSHFKDGLGLRFLSCNKEADNECYYCQKDLFSYESFYHFTGFNDFTSCDGCPMSLFECNITYNKDKSNELTVPCFGVYDEKCKNCIFRIEKVRGTPVVLKSSLKTSTIDM